MINIKKIKDLNKKLRKELLELSEIEEQMEHVESDLRNKSKEREEIRLIRRGMISELEGQLFKKLLEIEKDEEAAEKLYQNL